MGCARRNGAAINAQNLALCRDLLRQKKTQRQIAVALGVSLVTVNHYCKRIAKEIEEEIFENLKKLEEILDNYQVDTIIIGIPINMDGTEGFRVEVTKKFIHKLKCKFNKIKIEEIDERLTTVAAHKTMNYLGIKKENKKNIVDTISAVYILETYMNKPK